MRVKIGPYTRWIGPYQIADILQFVGVSKDKCYEIGEWLADTWVSPVCTWIDSKKNRKIKVRIDKYDTWSMDNTLALIILPMLTQLKITKQGSGHVDDDDVPDDLKSTSAPPKANAWDTDDNFFKRWDYVLDEMIFAFTAKNTDWDDQFHSGDRDMKWVQIEDGPHTGHHRLEKGPNDTHVFDEKGYIVFHDRMKNGFRLFGKYYEGLWT